MTTFYVKTYRSEYPEDKGKIVAYIGSSVFCSKELGEEIQFTVDLPYRNVATIPNHFFTSLGRSAQIEYERKVQLRQHQAEVREAYTNAYRLWRKYSRTVWADHGAQKRVRIDRELAKINIRFPEVVAAAAASQENSEAVDPLALPARAGFLYSRTHRSRPQSRLTGKVLLSRTP